MTADNKVEMKSIGPIDGDALWKWIYECDLVVHFKPELCIKLADGDFALSRPSSGDARVLDFEPEDGPFKVEVDDHSEDCGTVYGLRGPSTAILDKSEEWLQEKADDMNWGWYQAKLSELRTTAKEEKK